MKGNFRTEVLLCIILSTLLRGHAASQEGQFDQLSLASLKLRILRNDRDIGSATGFVVLKNNKNYLVTNRHVVLACALDRDPADIGGWLCANRISIFHNRTGQPGQWFWVTEDLFDAQGQKRWFEHPTLKGSADLVALPLAHTDGVVCYDLGMELGNTDIVVGPGDSVSIVGFPFGLAQDAGLPIWKTGTVASDFVTNVSGKPMFLVDTTSRQGMSGSPVYAVRSGPYRSTAGLLKMATTGSMKKFLGVYSEQNQDVELGGVWKAEAVKALYDSLP